MSRGVTLATAVVLLFGCLVGAGSASAAEPGCARADYAPTPETLTESYDAVLCLINAERTRRGLAAVKASGLLTRAAVAHSSDMVAKQYFSHVSPGGKTARQRVLNTGYFRGRPGLLDEALACGWQALSTPRQLVRTLMASRRHRQILLNRRMREIGIGLVIGGPMLDMPGGTTLTLDFARR